MRSLADRVEDIRRCRTVDFCFMVDITGSMQPYVDGVRKCVMSIAKLVEPLREYFHLIDENFRVAFVGYRDFKDQKQFEVLPFTTDFKEFVEFCEEIYASGGADIAEDVFGGINEVLRLQWSERAKTRIVFHIADAASHGTRFHAPDYGDDYPNEGAAAEDLFTQLRKHEILYYFGKIDAQTDIMITEFSKLYGETVAQYTVHDPNSIERAVMDILLAATEQSMMQAKRMVKGMPLIQYVRNTEIPAWDASSLAKSGRISEPGGEAQACYLRVAEQPFHVGLDMLLYYGQIGMGDLPDTYENCVLRRCRFLEVDAVAEKRLHYALQANATLGDLVQMFQQNLDLLLSPMKVCVKDLSMLTTDSAQYIVQPRFDSAETVLFEFSMNVSFRAMEIRAGLLGIRSKYIELIAAFSHWTHVHSKGEYILLDILAAVPTYARSKECNTMILLDGVVCHKNADLNCPLDLGEFEMTRFFELHRCNAVCESLGLGSEHSMNVHL